MLGLLLQIARVFALLSLVSIGRANAVLPEIRRRVVVVRGWMSDAAIANLFTISHAASGPNIIMVSLVGWAACRPGGTACCHPRHHVAVCLPSSQDI
jgi:chromate transport protein ChrA